jgi:tRNA (guanine10-N2)-methyltransferase
MLDAIVGDPPYGVRAGGRKSVAKDKEIRYRETHIPSTDPYPMTECIVDLLDLAGRLLKVGEEGS